MPDTVRYERIFTSKEFNYSLAKVKSNQSKRLFLSKSNNKLSKKSTYTANYHFAMIDNRPIEGGMYAKDTYDDDGERTGREYRHFDYVFTPSHIKMYAEEYRQQLPILTNHSKGEKCLPLGYAKDLKSTSYGKVEMLEARGELLVRDSDGNSLPGRYYAEMLNRHGVFPLSVGMIVENTDEYDEETGKGNLVVIENDGDKDSPDLVYVKEAVLLEISFVYQGQVPSAQATPYDKKEDDSDEDMEEDDEDMKEDDSDEDMEEDDEDMKEDDSDEDDEDDEDDDEVEKRKRFKKKKSVKQHRQYIKDVEMRAAKMIINIVKNITKEYSKNAK